MNNRGIVKVIYTIGFGNNIFQYCFSRLLADKFDMKLSHDGLDSFDIRPEQYDIQNNLPTYMVNDANCKELLEMKDVLKCNFIVNGYFEDYKIYEPHLGKIRSWFPVTNNKNSKDLIVHFRLQNRLVQVTHNKNHVTPDAYKRVFEKFEFDRLHIVTDAKKWDTYTEEDIEELRSEMKIGPNPPERSPWIPVEMSLEYMNCLVDSFRQYNPIIHCNGAPVQKGSGGLRADFMNDFNLLRSFEKIVIFNSTFSWWAALLGNAKQVATFGPWKPNKGKNAKNLGRTTFPGWFSWGSTEDLFWKEDTWNQFV